MAEPITPEQLAAIRAQAYATVDGREFVFVDELTEALRALAGDGAHCSDPIECGHEAALGQAEAERDQALAELAAIRERAHVRSEELLAYRDRRPSNDRVRRHAFELAANELRQLVEPPAGEAPDA